MFGGYLMGLRPLALAAAILLAAPAAASAATITFDGLPGSNGSAFTSYSEAGFTVTKSVGDLFVGKAYGNPAPSIFGGPNYGSAGASFDLTAAGSLFDLASFDFGANVGSATYALTGFRNGVSLFSLTGAQASGGFQTVLTGSDLRFDKVTFQLLSEGTSFNVDNISANISSAVPEPATWAMMIAGFLSVGSVLRRRRGVALAA